MEMKEIIQQSVNREADKQIVAIIILMSFLLMIIAMFLIIAMDIG